MLQAVGQALGGIKEIKLLAREEYFVQAYEENGRYYAGSLKRSQFFQYMPKYIIETVCVCGILGVVLLRIFLGAKTEELIPLLSVFAVAAFRLLPSVNAVNRLMSNILFLLPSVDKIYEDLQKAEDVQGRMVSSGTRICFRRQSGSVFRMCRTGIREPARRFCPMWI